MDFALSEDQQALRSSVAALLGASASYLQVREVMAGETGTDRELWALLARTGMVGLCIPEAYGGAGAGLVERSIVLEELGRTLACVPYLSSAVLAADTLLLAGGDAAAQTFLPRVADGSLVATLAVAEENGCWDLEDVVTRADEHKDGWRLFGTKSYVLDAREAQLVIVAARTTDGVGLFAVVPDPSTVTITAQDVLDPTRRMGLMVLDGARATLLSGADTAGEVLTQVLDRACLAMAGEQVGGAQRCLDDTVNYVTGREQFGTPIGTFQAVKHRCADMLLDVEAARALLTYGVCDPIDLHETVGLIKATCSESFLAVASASVQLHAGIGFTWEHSAHLFHKRALTSSEMFGSPNYHRDQFVDRTQLQPGVR